MSIRKDTQGFISTDWYLEKVSSDFQCDTRPKKKIKNNKTIFVTVGRNIIFSYIETPHLFYYVKLMLSGYPKLTFGKIDCLSFFL